MTPGTQLSRSNIPSGELGRREFLRCATTGAAVLAASGTAGAVSLADELVRQNSKVPETVVKHLYDSLTEKQRATICFPWDYVDRHRGKLRTRVAANWRVTKPSLRGDFYTSAQRDMVRAIFEGMIQPDWHARFDQQLHDDAGGWGRAQHIAIFGTPNESKFEFVITGRHMTLRCDGNTSEHVAFGGPIFYGHAPGTHNEPAKHPDNVFWHQAVAANRVFEMLDGRQRDLAPVPNRPREEAIRFRGLDGRFDGIPVQQLASDQQDEMRNVLQLLVEPYRQSDRDEVIACLRTQGGLENCHLAFYRDGDLGNDQLWDNWRLEGPAFVWYFRGSPHVHVWVHVADNPSVDVNA